MAVVLDCRTRSRGNGADTLRVAEAPSGAAPTNNSGEAGHMGSSAFMGGVREEEEDAEALTEGCRLLSPPCIPAPPGVVVAAPGVQTTWLAFMRRRFRRRCSLRRSVLVLALVLTPVDMLVPLALGPSLALAPAVRGVHVAPPDDDALCIMTEEVTVLRREEEPTWRTRSEGLPKFRT